MHTLVYLPATGHTITGEAKQFYLSPRNRSWKPWSPTFMFRSPLQTLPAHVLPSNIPPPPQRSNIHPPRGSLIEGTPSTCSVQAKAAAADTPCHTATGLDLHHGPNNLGAQRCQRLFHSLSKVLFIFRSCYLCAIGLGCNI